MCLLKGVNPIFCLWGGGAKLALGPGEDQKNENGTATQVFILNLDPQPVQNPEYAPES